jgi:DNA-binding LytR/AlgR family response regulator
MYDFFTVLFWQNVKNTLIPFFMKTITCLIVDDDPFFVEHLSKQIEALPFIKIIGVCKNYGETLLALSSQKVDFMLLDIKLESADGLDGFDLLQHNAQLPPVIIVSSYPEYAIESYTIGKAKDFLVKPFDNRRLLMAINRALDAPAESNPFFGDNSVFFKMGRRFQRFDIEDIDYFEGYGIYTKVMCQGVPHVINDSLSNLETALNAKRFMRVHKSYIINLNKLVGFDHNKLYLKNGSVPIGVSYKAKLESLLSLFDAEVSEADNDLRFN